MGTRAKARSQNYHIATRRGNGRLGGAMGDGLRAYALSTVLRTETRGSLAKARHRNKKFTDKGPEFLHAKRWLGRPGGPWLFPTPCDGPKGRAWGQVDAHNKGGSESRCCGSDTRRAGGIPDGTPLTDRNLATTPVGQLGGWKNVNVRLPCGLALGCGA